MSNQKPDFTTLEKESLKELSLETLKATLVSAFKKLHQEQLEMFEEKLNALESKCIMEIQRTVEKNVRKQLAENFQDIFVLCQKESTKTLEPFFKQTEKDVGRLKTEVDKAYKLCEEIQQKYAFQWSWPFFTLTFTAALTGLGMGLILFLMRTPPLSLFMLDPHSRGIYEEGLLWIRMENEYRTLEAMKKAEAAKAAKPVVKAVEPTPSKKKSKKKGSKKETSQ